MPIVREVNPLSKCRIGKVYGYNQPVNVWIGQPTGWDI